MPRIFKSKLGPYERNQLKLGSLVAKYPGRFPGAVRRSFSKLLNIQRK